MHGFFHRRRSKLRGSTQAGCERRSFHLLLVFEQRSDDADDFESGTRADRLIHGLPLSTSHLHKRGEFEEFEVCISHHCLYLRGEFEKQISLVVI